MRAQTYRRRVEVVPQHAGELSPTELSRTRYDSLPAGRRDAETHARIRDDRIDTSGVVTLRIAGRLHHIGIGRTHVVLLVHDLHVRT